jgi:peptide/nickel transport system permease protein
MANSERQIEEHRPSAAGNAPRTAGRAFFESPLLFFAIRRFLAAIPLLFAIVVFAFFLIHTAPGDPVHVMMGDFSASEEQIAELRAKMGLDQPVHVQFLRYLGGVLTGDLGYSYIASGPVLDLIVQRIPATLILMLPALLIFTALGVVLGVFVATRPYSAADNAASLGAVLGYSVPVFWLGQLAALLFAYQLGWLPAQGMRNFRADPSGWGYFVDLLTHLVLPATVLGTRYLAVNARLTRASMIEALGQDYIIKARAQGLPERVIRWHALRNAILPVVTMLGINFGDILTGTVLIEIVFGWPGLGRLMYDAIFARDYPLLMGLFILVAMGTVVANAVTDIVYSFVDPRVRQT